MTSVYKTSMGGADVIKEAWVEWASQLVLVIKNPPANIRDIRDMGSTPGSRKSPGGGHGNPFTVFVPGESHGQRSLVGYSP